MVNARNDRWTRERFLECSRRKRLAGWHSLERHYPRNFTTRERWTGNNSAYFFFSLSLFFFLHLSSLDDLRAEERGRRPHESRMWNLLLRTWPHHVKNLEFLCTKSDASTNQVSFVPRRICTPMQVINKIHLERQYVWKIDVRSLVIWVFHTQGHFRFLKRLKRRQKCWWTCYINRL